MTGSRRHNDEPAPHGHPVMTRGQFFASLRTVVHYHRTCGLTGYGGGERLEGALRALDASPAVERDKNHQVTTTMTAMPTVPSLPVEPQEAVDGVAELNAKIAACRSCPLYRQRIVDTAGTGAGRPRLLVVGEWLAVPPTVSVPPGVLFGVEEDRMLIRMITAIGLKPTEIFVTNIIKCAVPDTARPTPAQAFICFAYLKRQIELLSPLVICTMGTVAGQTLTGSDRPLSVLRGRLFSFCCVSGRELPLVPTYHPTFLLQNPEMKKAAWADLQNVAKKLQQARR